jgi:SAM-dependent methyltransferase
MPVDEVFEDGAFAELYDHFNPWMACDDFYLARAKAAGGPILDLGCGTGMLACRIAGEGLDVTGVDPAEGMLNVARNRPGSDEVAWLKSDGQSLDLPHRFELIYMTGHAFQALLTDDVAVAVLQAAARHLTDTGRFIFDTRNPAARAWDAWVPEQSRIVIETPEYGRVEEWYDTRFDAATGIASLQHNYRFLDRGTTQTGTSRIRFIDQEDLERLVDPAGLVMETCYGDWQEQPFQPDSREIIAVTGRNTA